MPDEAPVCDVLCTATDYLCRLGSNLRTRSENLRDKKISKSKLKNSHAIRKAADKVLLICELTKKSIVNVESSVKSILSAIGASQIGSEGDKNCSGNNTNNKFQYIECDSVKIRVSKSVPLKHYMSVKVHALRMPLSMQEKYPVYYNCKLYRHRKRQPVRSSRDTKETISNSDSINVSLDGKNTEPNSIQKNMEGKQESEHSNSSEKSKSSITCSSEKKQSVDNNTNETIDNHVNNNVSKSTSDKVNDESIAKKICIKTSSSRTKSLDTDSESISRKKEKLHECDESKSSREKESNIKRKSLEQDNKSLVGYTQNNVQENKEESIKISSLKKTSKTSQKKKHLILRSDEENQSENNVTSDKDNNESMRDEEEIKESSSELKSPKRLKCNKTGLKGKRSSMTIVSSDSDNLDENDQVNNTDKLDSCKDDSITVAEGNLTISSKGDSVTDVAGDENSQEVQKPMIKCVSLSKLLKPDIVDKTKKTPTKESPSKAGSSKRSEKSDNIHKNDKITKKGFTDLKKRTDVATFKPKSFAIHITRLPKLTVKFLQTHNLNKITKDGEVIVTIPSSPVVAPSTKANQEGPISKAINEAKTVLLDDSDGDNTDLLQKNAEDPVSGPVITETNVSTGHKSPTHSDSDKNKDKSPPATPPSKRKSASDGLTPKSKRRRIMENMHAKKMLLTYSSDSDTDDEKLRAVMKEMKESLLKGTSSGEDEDKDVNTKSEKEVTENLEPEKTTPESSEKKLEENNKKLSSPSESSEEDIFDKIKRRAHIKKDDKKNQSETDTDATKGKKHSSSSKMGRTKRSGGSSNQNSDTQETSDKDIDGLTNLDTLIKKNRRRDSTSTQSTNRTSSSGLRSSRRMPKAKPVDSDNILPVESSSDEASGGENVDEGVEDLPVVSLSELNGSAVDHLAKDDLLEESDSSHENDKGDEDAKPQESDDEDNLKSKRRKPQNTISSDSEVGSSRKKDARISDFEASDDSQPANQSKRRKKATDSDESVGSSDSTRKKKRRRIKPTNDSDGTGSDTENEGRNKHGRKNIRKVMGKNQLEEATKRAAREEKERIARIADRQKLYNNMQFDESGKPDEVVLDKVVLDFDPETKDPLIQVDRGLVKKLKPHQANGIKFMWDACFESVKRIKKDKGSGCILAHCMGLGKTLQVVTLTHTLLTHSNLTKVKRVLVVCPLSTVLNWVNEFRMWLKYTENECDIDVYELSRYKQNSERAYQLSQWFAHGGVCVLGYEMFRNLSSDTNKKFKKKMLKNFQESLVNPGPDMVVCDEGHLLKNEKTSLSQSMNRVTTLRRIVLTGTPLQNNLKEYYCMVQFVKPNLLGKYNEYLNRFVNPITNGQYTDSTEHDIRVMKRRSHVLHKMLDGSVQRRDYGVLAPFLPPKHEYVLFITLSAVQIKLYQHYLDNYSRRPLPGKSSGFLFPDFQSLQRIWTHPLVLKYNSERYEIMQQKKREREEEDSEGSLVDFIDDDDSTPDETSSEDSSEDLSDMSDDSRKKSKKKKSAKKGKGKDAKGGSRRGTRANPVEIGAEEEVKPDVTESRNENPTEWWMPLVTDDELEDMRHSHKLVLLFDILRQCDTIGDKLLVFSQSLYSLDLIEHFLGKVDEATQENRIDEKLCGHVGSWSPGVDYFRLDGSTSCENRSIWCKNFNREDNPRARLFLISTRAGGLGINLVAANRVVIFDVSWNPSHDVQSIFRVYRFGQKKPCYVYRFLAMGTMEEKIYERQVTKQAISKRVIDEQQIDRHYAENDLAELYKFEPIPPPRQLPPLPKDRLFAEMLKEHENQIYKYHEHDSLLENKEEETLTEEERKAAWEDFENEKNRPPPAPFQAWPMHNGMMPNLLAQQQQQLAYAALAQMLRKDMPTINDNQIRDMLPLIYNSNPGLMQKMSEIYKYTQPGMMQSMMNPAMHSGAAGGGSGGSSGLQYEPPWQRQQQLRMQQLMQQQNMGANAKYYAGGLGSRDPVAMALQQQRAREIMLGERARPRGRPPLAPRVPASDVVNLDSD